MMFSLKVHSNKGNCSLSHENFNKSVKAIFMLQKKRELIGILSVSDLFTDKLEVSRFA